MAAGVTVSTVWHVTRLDDGNAFTWESSGAGVNSVGVHAIERGGTGTRVTLTIAQSGIGAMLLSPFFARLAGATSFSRRKA